MDESREVRMHPLDYLLVLRRRRRWFVVPFLVCLVAGILVTFLLPTKYRSSTTIAISGGAVSSDLTQRLDRDERIRAFGQQLLALPTLARVVREEHLTPSRPSEAELLALKQRIQISLAEPVPGSDPGQVTAYMISYSDSTAERARRVAQRLAEVFVDETSKTREGRAEESSEFLAAQLRESKDRLDRLDARLGDQKKLNMGRLPEQTNTNLGMVSALRQQLDTTSTELRGQQDRLAGVEREIAMFSQAPSDSSTTPTLPNTAQERVVDIERRLAAARAQYTENYPDVQQLEMELARAKKDAAAEAQLPAQKRLAILEQNPAYRALETDRDNIRLRMRDLERTIAQLNGQIRSYEARLEQAPMVEQQMAAVSRDYEAERKRFEDLNGQYNRAVLAENLERKSGSEHFRILYPATLPDAPYEPNRQRLLLLTVAASLFLGVGSAVGREYLDRSVHDARGLQQEFDLPVLGEIPHIDRAA